MRETSAVKGARMSIRLATLEQDSWYLDNGVEAHQRDPNTFWIPNQVERENLEPGQLVKLKFVIRIIDENNNATLKGERMWVSVNSRSGEFYIGALDNDSYFTDTLTSGTSIIFKPEHVIDIWHG